MPPDSASSWMTPAACLAMPIPTLAVEILRRLATLDDTWRNAYNFTQWTVDGSSGWFPTGGTITTSVYVGTPPNPQREALKTKLREAWTWLEKEGYVVDDHSQRVGNWKTITAAGWEIARSSDTQETLARVQAATQLNLELHHRLRAANVDATFRAGDTDSAIRDAFVELEHAVRTLAGYSKSDYGVQLMTKAFGPNGPLRSFIDSQEQNGMQRIFEGAYGLLRNPAGHGPTGLGVTESAETVLEADLLMRRLDRIAAKMGKHL